MTKYADYNNEEAAAFFLRGAEKDSRRLEMGDQFSKTISSVSGDYALDQGDRVQAARDAEGKVISRRKSVTEKQKDGSGGHEAPYSSLRLPDSELWNTLIEAVRVFNEHQDIRNSPFAIRIWAQNNGVRVQLIHEETGNLIKQTKIILFSEITDSDINRIINELIVERGVVIDIAR